ncbi:hypothetical protein D3C76_926360 [compost metagenome]
MANRARRPRSAPGRKDLGRNRRCRAPYPAVPVAAQCCADLQTAPRHHAIRQLRQRPVGRRYRAMVRREPSANARPNPFTPTGSGDQARLAGHELQRRAVPDPPGVPVRAPASGCQAHLRAARPAEKHRPGAGRQRLGHLQPAAPGQRSGYSGAGQEHRYGRLRRPPGNQRAEPAGGAAGRLQPADPRPGAVGWGALQRQQVRESERRCRGRRLYRVRRRQPLSDADRRIRHGAAADGG